MSASEQKKAQALRQRAQAILREKNGGDIDALELKSVRELAVELALHQAELALQNETLLEYQGRLQDSSERYRVLFEHAPVGYVVLDRSGIIRQCNATWLTMLNRADEDLRGKAFSEFLHEEDKRIFLARYRSFFKNPQKKQIELRLKRKGADPFFVRIEAISRSLKQLEEDPAGQERMDLMITISDIDASRRSQDALNRIEWLMTPKPARDLRSLEPSYGDLTDHNEGGLILRSVGKSLLRDIVSDYLDYMETSAAVYEKNGDYALGLFSSGWCRFMDEASRKRYPGEDNLQALKSGAWLCHESCWTQTSLRAIETGQAMDVPCAGGLRIYAEPIRSAGEIIGAINFGYGDPPQDLEKQKELAQHFGVGLKELKRNAQAYESRPAFIIEVAKKRLASSARLIGEIVERKRFEEALQKSENQLQSVFRSAPVGIGVVVNRVITEANQRLCRMTGYSREELVGQSARILYGNDADFDFVGREKYRQIRERGTGTVETRWRRKDGVLIDVLLSSTPIEPDDLQQGVTFSALDISEGKKAAEEGERLRTQLAQTQKMESIGRLAGGVAHDFNNMLGVILGHTEMLLAKNPDGSANRNGLLEIQKAAERSADLTRQLLAFARKQTVAPRVIHLNSTIEGTLKMLRRLIGEDIELAWLPGKATSSVNIDPAQIDQILANLCVNARDAIDGVGKITIETAVVEIDEAYCRVNAGFIPGSYVLIAVSDNGQGMDQDTLARIFEPFYTTKEMGKGTGLGLATVYGIVKQNGGFINVYSEADHGSRFSIYLPRHGGEAVKTGASPRVYLAEGKETILLVEDEPSILKMIGMMLQHLGYTVLASSSPSDALRMADSHAGSIDLLITDVVMPEMNGRELAQKLLKRHPKVKRLFMSGYTANVIAHHGVLDAGIHFIQKPFAINDLSVKIRQALHHD